MKSNVIKWHDPNSNMYGCQPCPKCKSRYRASYNREHGRVIECDDCGYKENVDEENSDE